MSNPLPLSICSIALWFWEPQENILIHPLKFVRSETELLVVMVGWSLRTWMSCAGHRNHSGFILPSSFHGHGRWKHVAAVPRFSSLSFLCAYGQRAALVPTQKSLYLYIYLSFSDLNTIIYPLILYNDLCTWIVTMHLVFSKCWWFGIIKTILMLRLHCKYYLFTQFTYFFFYKPAV